MASVPQRRLDDSQLRVAELLVDDPSTVEGLTDDPPDASYGAIIVAEYHLSKDREVRCSYCEQRQPHQHGFVAEFAPARRHLIGSECGTTKLDLQFKAARNSHKELITRQAYLVRLDLIRERSDQLISECHSVLTSEALKAVEVAGSKFEELAGDAAIRLRSLDGRLQEDIRVRDRAAEDRLPDDDKRHIYRVEQVAIGQLRGRAILRANRLRDRVFAFKKELRGIVSLALKDTNAMTTAQLRKAFKTLDVSYDDANAAIGEINRAPTFFASDNVNLLARWAVNGTTNDIRSEDGSLIVKGSPFAMSSFAALNEIGSIR